MCFKNIAQGFISPSMAGDRDGRKGSLCHLRHETTNTYNLYP